MKFLKKYWAVFALFILVSVLLYFNFDTNTYLSGWDNLHPEFNPVANLERAWQASWEEYQGLGLLGGMAHAADLFRQLILFPIYLLLPVGLGRYFWHFLMIFVGVFGAYRLILFFIYDWHQGNKNLFQRQLVAFLGAAFYLLNFATIQNFYTTFEPFASFFGFLPWLLVFLMELLEFDFKNKKKEFKKKLICFLVVSVLATTMAYVQTIFIVYIFFVVLILLNHLLRSFNKSKKQGQKALRTSFLIVFIIFAVNAFWFLPVLHFMLTGSDLLQFSKSKAMSNDELFLRNQAHAKFTDIARMRGFWLWHSDFDSAGNAVYLMDAWKTHLANPFVNILSWGFFALVVLAIFDLLKGKNRYKYLILVSFAFSFFMISTGNFPFAILTKLFQAIIPFFYEMFRISFTKWVIPFSLFYSILLAFGINQLLTLVKNKLWKLLLSILLGVLVVIYSFPSFKGNYFYKNIRVNMPEAYMDLFAYFDKDVDHSSRIANFPQYSFNGWQWNDWGYRGSGFLWYGIKQPILDRAFDVWSEADERYYWQIQYALDKKDISLFENVLRQYDVDYLILDQSIVNRNTNEPFIYDSWIEFLAESDLISLEKDFDFIKVYSFADDENSREKDFLSFYSSLDKIENNYAFSYYDQAFSDSGDYLSNNEAEVVYPFPSLFTNHTQGELEFEIKEDEDYFYLYPEKSLVADFESLELITKNYLDQEKYFPVKISWRTSAGLTVFDLESELSDISWKDKNYSWNFKKSISLNSQLCQTNDDCYLVINNEIIQPFTEKGKKEVLLSSRQSNVISFARKTKVDYYDYAKLDFSFFELKQTIKSLEERSDLQVRIPKVKTNILGQNLLETELNQELVKNCDSFLDGTFYKEIIEGLNNYQSQGSKSCDSFYVSNLDHAQSYLLTIKAANKKSLPFLFAVQSPSQSRSPIETFLRDSKETRDNYIIIPPTEDFNSDYNLYFSTDSYGREKNENQLADLRIYYFPSNFIRSLKLSNPVLEVEAKQINTCQFEVNNKSLWFYQISLDKASCDQELVNLKLSQAYSDDWLAFTKNGFLDHSKINNWANAWSINLADHQDNEIIVNIFFWPQLLEYLGLGLLVFVGIYLILRD